MDTEKQHDGLESTEDANERNNRADAFLGPEERTMIRKSVQNDMGLFWKDMNDQEQDRKTKEVTANIIVELMTMAGGIWKDLSPEKKRELFRARFVETSQPEAKGVEASETPATEEPEFPGVDAWLSANENNLQGMKLAEKVKLYQAAKSKAGKPKQ